MISLDFFACISYANENCTKHQIQNSSSEYDTEAKDLELSDLSNIEKWLISLARLISMGNSKQTISKTTAENLVSLMKMINHSPKFIALLTFLRYEAF